MASRSRWRRTPDADWGLSRYRWRDAALEAIVTTGSAFGLLRLALGHVVARACLARVPDLRLVIGSGATIPDGWYGLDLLRSGPRVFRADVRLGLPVQTATTDAILAEHVLEHLYLDELPPLLTECRRVLRAGSPIRIVSPSGRHLASLLLREDGAEHDPAVAHDAAVHRWDPDGLRWARSVNRIAHQWGQHRSLLTEKMVSALLARAGFTGIRPLAASQTAYFPTPPDVHPRRFADEPEHVNFAVEALAGGG